MAEKRTYVADLVSIIIPSYERFDYVQAAIQSVLNQTYPHIELIVVDDCSPDERYKTLDELYPTVKFMHLPINTKEVVKYTAPQGAVRHIGCTAARGEFIAFLDDDDAYCVKTKIQTQVDLLKKYSNHTIGTTGLGHKLCSTNMFVNGGKYTEGRTGNPWAELVNGPGLKLEPSICSINHHEISNYNYVANSTVLFYHETYDLAGGMKAEQYEDWECWKRMSKYTNILYYNVPTTYYECNHGGMAYYKY
jgi:glycosyltransferase involved in cell wall biosynthesis